MDLKKVGKTEVFILENRRLICLFHQMDSFNMIQTEHQGSRRAPRETEMMGQSLSLPQYGNHRNKGIAAD